jgi:hypothetical protein
LTFLFFFDFDGNGRGLPNDKFQEHSRQIGLPVLAQIERFFSNDIFRGATETNPDEKLSQDQEFPLPVLRDFTKAKES